MRNGFRNGSNRYAERYSTVPRAWARVRVPVPSRNSVFENFNFAHFPHPPFAREAIS